MTVELPTRLPSFPGDFAWGAATAAYQIEGSPDADGRGASIWDVFSHTRGRVARGDTGDVACDHYRRYADDVDLMARLGLRGYRFSVSWPRVIPAGTGTVNEAGLSFYDRLVDALLERGIEPYLTLYHWDLPQALQEGGGWAAPDVVDSFAQYADVVARRLGDRVHQWITLNEPQVFTFHGYGRGVHAPGIRHWGTALHAAHHAILAHAAATRAVRAAVPGARIGIALDLSDIQPASDSPADRAAAARLDAAAYRWFLDAVFGRGYPPEQVAWYGAAIGGIDPGQVRGVPALDFLGINYYTRQLVRAARTGPLRVGQRMARGTQRTEMGWEVYPDGLRRVLVRVAGEYRPPAIYITENGAAFRDQPDRNGRVEDADRTAYLRSHIDAVGAAITDGAPVRGYFVWSLLDNFEWAEGYQPRFGIVRVDYATQRRIVKASGEWYAELIARHRGASI